MNDMTKFQRWLLKIICKKLVTQGYSHEQNITEYYHIMKKAAEKEFIEDNEPTFNSFLDDCYKKAQEREYAQMIESPPIRSDSDKVYNIGTDIDIGERYKFKKSHKHKIFSIGSGKVIVYCPKAKRYYLHIINAPNKFALLCRGCNETM